MGEVTSVKVVIVLLEAQILEEVILEATTVVQAVKAAIVLEAQILEEEILEAQILEEEILEATMVVQSVKAADVQARKLLLLLVKLCPVPMSKAAVKGLAVVQLLLLMANLLILVLLLTKIITIMIMGLIILTPETAP